MARVDHYKTYIVSDDWGFKLYSLHSLFAVNSVIFLCVFGRS